MNVALGVHTGPGALLLRRVHTSPSTWNRDSANKTDDLTRSDRHSALGWNADPRRLKCCTCQQEVVHGLSNDLECLTSDQITGLASFLVAFIIFVTDKDRNFEFSTRVDHSKSQPTDNNYVYKKLSYRRVTARCVLSVVILPIATQQRRNYLYDKSWPNWWYEVGVLVRGNVSLTMCTQPSRLPLSQLS